MTAIPENEALRYLSAPQADESLRAEVRGVCPVSYTHLTLPTIRLV